MSLPMRLYTGGAGVGDVCLGIVDVAAPQRKFGERPQQPLLLRCRRLLQDRGEFRRQPRFHGQPSPNRPIAILGRGQQRHPVVVEIADVLVGEVVDRVLAGCSPPRPAAAVPSRRAGCPRSAPWSPCPWSRTRTARDPSTACIRTDVTGSATRFARTAPNSGRWAIAAKCCANTRVAPHRVRSSLDASAAVSPADEVSGCRL